MIDFDYGGQPTSGGLSLPEQRSPETADIVRHRTATVVADPDTTAIDRVLRWVDATTERFRLTG